MRGLPHQGVVFIRLGPKPKQEEQRESCEHQEILKQGRIRSARGRIVLRHGTTGGL